MMMRPAVNERGSGGEPAARGSVVFTLALLCATLVMLVTTFGLPPASRLVPLAVAIPLTGLLSYRLVRDIMAVSRPAGPGMPTASEARVIAWLPVLPGLATLLGYIAGPALFVFLWARFRGREAVVYSIAAAVVTGLLLWGLFGLLLGLTVPRGILFSGAGT